MSVNDKPLVSIGLPVFNGERYLAEAIESIIGQSFTDFELIISDNASTDGTREICQAYASQDSRLHYRRNQQNIGAAGNFNRTFELSRGKYFKWAAHDDIIAPDFVEKCVAVLEAEPSVALCHAKTSFIDGSGDFKGNCEIELDKSSLPKCYDRFADLVLIDHWCFAIFGLIRREVLKQSPLIANYIASDRVLLAELALRGRFYEIPEFLFFSRQHVEQSINAIYYNFRAGWFDPKNADKVTLPNWRLMAEYLKGVGRVRLTFYEKLRCYLHMVHWLGVNVHWARLMADVLLAVHPRSVGFVQKAENWYYNHRNKSSKTRSDLRSV